MALVFQSSWIVINSSGYFSKGISVLVLLKKISLEYLRVSDYNIQSGKYFFTKFAKVNVFQN
jgi:hypothetical protein